MDTQWQAALAQEIIHAARVYVVVGGEFEGVEVAAPLVGGAEAALHGEFEVGFAAGGRENNTTRTRLRYKDKVKNFAKYSSHFGFYKSWCNSITTDVTRPQF